MPDGGFQIPDSRWKMADQGREIELELALLHPRESAILESAILESGIRHLAFRIASESIRLGERDTHVERPRLGGGNIEGG
jgi:hypothetical protein